MTLVVVVLSVSIVLTVLAYGLNASRSELGHLVRRPHLLIVSLLSMFVLMPVLAILAIYVVDAPTATKIAVVALALSPVPTLVARKQLFSGERARFAVSLTVFSSAAAIVLAPTMAALVSAILGERVSVSPASLALRVAAFILAPLALGLAVRRWRPELAQRLRSPVLRVSQVMLALAVVALAVATIDEILTAAAPSTLALMLLFVLAGIGVAHLALPGRRDEAHVLATVNFSRHPAIAIGIAAASYPELEFAAVILLYVLVSAAAAAVYRWLVERRQPTEMSARSATRS